MVSDKINPEDAAITVRENDEPGKVVQCDACFTEVPLSVAKSFEGLDYVHHFCGLNCLEKWLAQAQPKPRTTPDKE